MKTLEQLEELFAAIIAEQQQVELSDDDFAKMLDECEGLPE